MYKILLIEDEDATAGFVKKALENNGYEVEIAVDGEEGVLKFEKGNYDLVLLDLKLPKKEGVEVLQDIRRIDPYVYVIVYTNYSVFADIKRLTNIGVDGYINKGADAELQDVVDMVKDKLDPLNGEDVSRLVGGAFV